MHHFFDHPGHLVDGLELLLGGSAHIVFKGVDLLLLLVDLLLLIHLMGELSHYFLVHVLDVILDLPEVFGNRRHLSLVLLQLELVSVLDSFHVLSVLEVLHEFPFDLLNDILLLPQLSSQVPLLLVVLSLVFLKLSNLHLGFED